MKVNLELTLRQVAEIDQLLRDRAERLETWIGARHTGVDECKEYYEELGVIKSIVDESQEAKGV